MTDGAPISPILAGSGQVISGHVEPRLVGTARNGLRLYVPETRFVNCETCGTEGRIYRMGVSSRWDIEPREDDLGPCPDCHGDCDVEVPVEPVTEAEIMHRAVCRACGESLDPWRYGHHCPRCGGPSEIETA